MLRLPQSAQLVGIVQVEGQREPAADDDSTGLVPSADREGFVVNAAFRQLRDIIRGSVEAVAESDRRLQQEEEEEERQAQREAIREETNAAIDEIDRNPRRLSLKSAQSGGLAHP